MIHLYRRLTGGQEKGGEVQASQMLHSGKVALGTGLRRVGLQLELVGAVQYAEPKPQCKAPVILINSQALDQRTGVRQTG
jgi:rhodanese-related sulfurtransferase